MFETVAKVLTGRSHPEAKRDVFQLFVLQGFVLAGFILGLALFFRDLFGVSPDECLAGDVSITLLFGAALYLIRLNRIKRAIQLFFLFPVVPYFFFISNAFSIFPNQLSIPYTQWTLIPFFLVYLIYDEKVWNLSVFYLLSVLTLFVHTIVGHLTDFLFVLSWPVEKSFVNPFLTLSVFYAITVGLSRYFRGIIRNLIAVNEATEKQISQTIRNLTKGVMVLEIVYDEFGTATHLVVRRTNLAFERIFRITSRELKDRQADDVFPKLFRSAFDWNKHFLQAESSNFEFFLDRVQRYYDVFSFRSGSQVVCLFSDVTARQEQILALEESSHRYQVLLEAVPDLFFIIDKDGIYVDFVFKASETLKIKPSDIIGNSIFEVGFSEKMSGKVYQCIQQCIETDSIETIEYALEVEGATAMFEMRIVRLNDHSVITLARDISKRKLAEIKLEEAKIKAEEADQLKTAFLANISHEIRTPMNAIIGFSKMIGSPDFDDEEKNKFVDIIITNGKLLLSLINDMISLSKIESNTLLVKFMPTKINEMMLNLHKEFSYDIEDKKNIQLKLKCANPNPKFTVLTDPVLLQAIMEKLVDNGIKFTEHGEVEFGYRFTSNDSIEFFVTDTGIGIAEKDQEKIFQRFHQLDNRTIRAYEGTGLGLSIAQHYVRLLGGKLNVNSKPGRGSVFYFEIPYTREESPLKIVR
jgi:PAS domain S-box-containing protein